MQICPECYPCFLNQAIEGSRRAGASPDLQKRILDRILRTLADFPSTATPPELGAVVDRTIKEMTGTEDPFSELKVESYNFTIKMLPYLKKRIKASPEPLKEALDIAILGNLIDYGVTQNSNAVEKVDSLISDIDSIIDKQREGLYCLDMFKTAVEAADTILYIGDNVGEITFDKLFIETLLKKYPDKDITFAVRGKAVLNDAVIADAEDVGLHKITNLVSSGSEIPGTVLRNTTKKFQEIFSSSDLIISKGQGNYETLSDEEGPLFFLLMAKCPAVAGNFNADVGSILLLKNSTE